MCTIFRGSRQIPFEVCNCNGGMFTEPEVRGADWWFGGHGACENSRDKISSMAARGRCKCVDKPDDLFSCVTIVYLCIPLPWSKLSIIRNYRATIHLALNSSVNPECILRFVVLIRCTRPVRAACVPAHYAIRGVVPVYTSGYGRLCSSTHLCM
jgi:hypothetical protein